MAIVQMQKVAILAHQSQREELIALLHDEGVLEVSDAKSGVEFDHTEVNFRSAEVQFGINVLKDVASKETLAVAAKAATVEEIIHAAKHTDVRGIVEKLHELEKEDTEANRMLQECKTQEDALIPWQNLRTTLCDTNETTSTMHVLGTMPLAKEGVLREDLDAHTKKNDMQKIGEEKGIGYYSVMIWKDDIATFEELATTHGWSNVVLPESELTATELLEETRANQKELQKILEKNASERSKLAVELPNLIKVRRFLRWLDEKQGVREAMAETDQTFTLFGWMPRNKIGKVESKLANLSKAIAILKVKPEEGEEPPVLLKNSKLFAPFESVTNLYGLPLPNEMDPTRALSPFFILYFALCLTDAGYGAVLALIFGTVLLKTRKSIQDAKLIWLLFFGGIVTFLVSIPFGGWFGLSPEQVPAFLTKQTEAGLYFKGQIWNLTQQSGIDFLQNLSLALGITHLFFGMFLAGMHKWVHGNKAGAFWIDFTSHILLGAIILYVVTLNSPYAQYTLYALYAAIGLLVWGKGYGSKWYLRPLIGLIGLLNFCIGMISNGLSYLRILALGLVTGAIAAAVNQVAVEMGKLFPIWIAIPVIILICFFGHLVSIALNTLGSFIHSGRLQFIEFFSQFFEGGGKAFTPFKRSTTS